MTPLPLLPDAEHVHTGQWCRPCVQHGADTALALVAEAQATRAVPDRSHLEIRPPEPEPPKADRRGDWGCSVFVVALLAVVLAAASPLPVTYSGIVNYADPSHGRYYLAIPDGRGVRVEICGPAGCLIRTSTDAGPDLAMQRAGRIADLNSVDWLAISGVPLRFGGFQGTILILKRPARIELPQTDMEGP